MRTDSEILARIKERQASDFLGAETGILILRLPFDAAKQFLKEDAPADAWDVYPRDRESLLEEMQEYMPFAWEKANDGRGLSAWRSMSHYQAWTWLAGDDLGELSDYSYYGKDNLVRICQYYGWDSKRWDDGIRSKC